MNTDEFQNKLEEIQDLMRQEKYDKALHLLEELKEIEQMRDFDYSLTHKLYQLISNSKSLYNQQKILSLITQISQKQESVSLVDLNQKLKDQENLVIELSILKREIEILILRSLLKCQIDGDLLIFN